VLDWPGQVVIGIGSMFWTREVEQQVRSKGAQGLAEYGAKLTAQLDDIVQLVRGKLSKLERCTLSSLAVVDVHGRDVIQALAEAKMSAVDDFDWTSQLRYYWEDDTLNVKVSPCHHCIPHSASASRVLSPVFH